jgi:D-tyrosyl-tRNA(Tyr) deacylase
MRSIGPGLAILVGAGPTSNSDQAAHLAEKTANLRIFSARDDPRRRPNLSLLETRGQALVVSQFTLYADTSRGRRPSYLAAGDPARARELCETFAQALERLGIPTERGSFGAHMVVSIENDGPVTVVLSTDDWATRL